MEDSLRDIEDQIKKSNICSEGVQKKQQGEWRRDNIEMIIEKLFQIYVYVNYQIQAVQLISNMITTTESTTTHHIETSEYQFF